MARANQASSRKKNGDTNAPEKKKGAKRGGTKGTGFIFQKKEGVGNYYFQYSERGKRKTISLKTRNRREAEKKADALRKEIASLKTKQDYLDKVAETRGLIKASDVKLADGWKHYLAVPDEDRPNSSPGTMENYQRHYAEFVHWMESHHPDIECLSDAITTDIAREYCQHMKNQGLSPNTFNYKRGSLMLIWRVLSDKAGLTSNIWREIPRAKATKRTANGLDGTQARRKALPFYESVELLKVFDDPEFHTEDREELRLLFFVGVFTGLRLVDAVKLRWDQISELGNGAAIELYPQKTLQFGKRVTIPLDDRLRSEIERMRDVSEGEHVMPSLVERYDHNRGVGLKKDITRVFQHAGHETTIAKGTYQRQRNIANVGFHSLRASLFSYLAGRGLTVEKLAAISGDSAATLSKYYLKSEQTELAESVRGVLGQDERLAEATSEVIDVTPTTEPERNQLKRLADELPIETVKTILKGLNQ